MNDNYDILTPPLWILGQEDISGSNGCDLYNNLNTHPIEPIDVFSISVNNNTHVQDLKELAQTYVYSRMPYTHFNVQLTLFNEWQITNIISKIDKNPQAEKLRNSIALEFSIKPDILQNYAVLCKSNKIAQAKIALKEIWCQDIIKLKEKAKEPLFLLRKSSKSWLTPRDANELEKLNKIRELLSQIEQIQNS